MNTPVPYGQGLATFNAAGGLEGIHMLVVDFYHFMSDSEEYSVIRKMHPENIELSIDKLTAFLSGWMGGESLYTKKFGPISIPFAHASLKIGTLEKDMWMACMKLALEKQVSTQNYSENLVIYLLEQFAVPAERIRQVCSARHHLSA